MERPKPNSEILATLDKMATHTRSERERMYAVRYGMAVQDAEPARPSAVMLRPTMPLAAKGKG